MTEHTNDFYQEEYEEYIKGTKLEARFDPMTIQLLVTEAIPKHDAYELSFEDYLKQRSRFYEYDEAEKKRLSFYLPLFPALLSADFATDYKISYHSFLVRLVEIGLIHFQYDYNDQYQNIKSAKQSLSKKITDEDKKTYYLHLDNQIISLGSGVGNRASKTKHFTPSVPEWLYNASTDCSSYINMSISDFVYLCWCIGLVETVPESNTNPVIVRESIHIINNFDRELRILEKRINQTVSEINEEE